MITLYDTYWGTETPDRVARTSVFELPLSPGRHFPIATCAFAGRVGHHSTATPRVPPHQRNDTRAHRGAAHHGQHPGHQVRARGRALGLGPTNGFELYT